MSISVSSEHVDDLFAGLSPAEARRAQQSISLVRDWLARAAALHPARSAKMLADVISDADGLAFTVGFVDGVIRPHDNAVAARELRRLSRRTPRFLPWWMRAAVRVGGGVAPAFPDVVVPIARRVLRRMVGHLIVDSSPDRLGASIRKLRRSGVQLNINLLGEAVLGQREAARRLEGTKQLLRRDDVDYVSIKVSSTVAPRSPWAFDAAVDDIVEELKPLFDIAATASTQKFVNLDMEEYRDLDLTIAVFTRLLDRQEFHGLSAGIVLQAYLPDALASMIRLQNWSALRTAQGGADIKVRVVKGANLPMEIVEARLHGWPLATYDTKQDTDANYKRVLDYALDADRLQNVRIGIAGHNLFDIAHSWTLAADRGITHGVDYEMLLGMAEGQAVAVRETVGSLRLYTPVVSPEHFDAAIAYLIRRLEEGASGDNFMSAVFAIGDSDALFGRERDRYLASLRDLAALRGDGEQVPQPRRTADRFAVVGPATAQHFENVADTDPSVAANRDWARAIVEAAADSHGGDADGTRVIADAWIANAADLDAVLSECEQGGLAWGEFSAQRRAQLLRSVGAALEANRARLIAVAISETGKTLEQADPEVSEAVDFAYYYADRAEELDSIDGARFRPTPLTVVAPPWNFPLAIPAGSTLAALAAGSGVVLKPAPQARRCGSVLAEILWQAGIPRSALALVQLDDDPLGGKLIADQRVRRVILTGAYETAELFRSFRQDLPIHAETSGKNAIIVTPSADFDLAVKDVVASAFGHAGQKCSAASLVILVGSVATSRRFQDQLVDAVESLAVGSECDLSTQVNRLVEPPSGKLLRALTELEPGQSWLVEPHQVGADPRLWSPGVRLGVNRGSEFHRTEYFGPVLGVMAARDLLEAIALVNEIDYGLTSGLHSLDRSEVAKWLDEVEAGNLYVNRGITGAIVRRQPFGGWKKSAVGAGAKAGGPNYLFSLGGWDKAEPLVDSAEYPVTSAVNQLLRGCGEALSEAESRWLVSCSNSDARAWAEVFCCAEDVSSLEFERNIFRYRAVASPTVIRFGAEGRVVDLVRAVSAALAASARVIVSVENDMLLVVRSAIEAQGVPVLDEPGDVWAQRLARPETERVRAVGVRAGDVLGAAGYRVSLAVWDGPVTGAGRLEMLPFLREQAVSITCHRFGNLIDDWP